MKLKRLAVFFSINFILCLFLLSSGFCATYYVKDSGNDNASGLSDAEAWRTIQKVNNYSFKDGDTVRFKRGDVFDDQTLTLNGSKPDNFTVEDYGTGSKPLFDGDVIMPISISNINNLTIRNLDIGGQDWSKGKSNNVLIYKVKGVTIDGLIGDGHKDGNTSDGKNAIQINECSGAIIVKNCNLYNWGPSPMLSLETDFNAIAIMYIVSGSIEVYDNICHDINSDAVVTMDATVPNKIHNNTFWNCGENGVDIKGSDNVEVYNNNMFREKTFTGRADPDSPGVLIVVHGHGSGKSIAENNIIRDNYLHDCDDGAILIGFANGQYGAKGVKVYRNRIENCKGVLYISKYIENVYFNDNVIVNPIHWASGDAEKGCILVNYSEDTGSGSEGINIVNNILYSSNSTMKELIYLGLLPSGAGGIKIRDNIVYSNSVSDSYLLRWTGAGAKPDVSGNKWYHPENSKRIAFGKTNYLADQEDSWVKDGHPRELFNEKIDILTLISDGDDEQTVMQTPKNLREIKKS